MRLTLAIALLASPAFAGGTIIVSPVYSQLVALPVPADFKAGFENEHQGAYILELTPRSETVEAWSEMVALCIAGTTGANHY